MSRHSQPNYPQATWSACYPDTVCVRSVSSNRSTMQYNILQSGIKFVIAKSQNKKPEYRLTQNHQTLVDVVGLLQRFAFAVGLLGHLAAGQIDKVDFTLLRYEHTAFGLLLRGYVHRQDRMTPGRVVVHRVAADGTVSHA